MSVQTSKRANMLIITLDRVAKRNALNADVTAGLDAALNELEDDPSLWCGIVTGGTEVFSAGADPAAGPGEPTPRGGLVDGDEAEAWTRSNAAHARLLETNDFREGIGAFFERRLVHWTGT